MTRYQRAAVVLSAFLVWIIAVCAWTGDWAPLIGIAVAIPMSIVIVFWIMNGKD